MIFSFDMMKSVEHLVEIILGLRKAMYPFMNGDSTISKNHFSKIESLPHDVVEQILERLAAKTLVRFKVMSKQWKSTIESRFFQESHLTQHKQSGNPYVFMVSVYVAPGPVLDTLRTLVVSSSSSVKIPTPWEENNDTQTRYLASHSSCDGLVCVYSPNTCYVLNPITRWYRTLPLSHFQQLDYKQEDTRLGFGKDKFSATYKPVWLYNSKEIGRENATTCEVFDFSTNAWKYVAPAAPYRVLCDKYPVYVDGSLHWFTECHATKVVSMDLHTEVFQVLPITPFYNLNRLGFVMCNLDNRVCITRKKFPIQVIWCFNSGNKTWDKVYSIDVKETIPSCYGCDVWGIIPLAILDGENKNKKLLLFCREFGRQTLVLHDPETKSYEVAFSAKHIGCHVCYFPSLISIL